MHAATRMPSGLLGSDGRLLTATGRVNEPQAEGTLVYGTQSTLRLLPLVRGVRPDELIHQARLAQQAGFEALWISDHFHPWLDEQGQSAFVWSLIGAVSQATSLPVTTAVTCPLVRQHPAIVAQAAATSALLTNGGFALGLGTGEALNEHILGTRWPSADERLEMLEEAVQVIRSLFSVP